MKTIESRSDIENLIHNFYCKIRSDETLGPIFNSMIDDWPKHESKLVDFWETNLFVRIKYKGNPVKVHQEVDLKTRGHIHQGLFFRWLQLWYETIDELFEGELAALAKARARKMATHLFMKVFIARQKYVDKHIF